MTKQLNELLKMVNSKVDFFAIKECAESIGFTLESMSVPSLKTELSVLIANSELNDEALTLVIA
jgi:hypothetical protein